MKEQRQRELQKVLSDCTMNPNVSLADITELFALIRELYDFDTAFAMTNKEYKYQVRHLIYCEKPGTTLLKHDHISMTFQEYNVLLDYYQNHPYYERRLTMDQNGCDGYVLQCAVIRDNEYYGTVGFGRADHGNWTDEEKELIRLLSQVVLVYIGLNRLKDRRTKLDLEEKILIRENTLEFFHVDLVSGKCHALKVTSETEKWCEEWENYEDVFQHHISHYVNETYAERLRRTMSLESMRRNLSIQNPQIVSEYPAESHDELHWVRGIVQLSESDENNESRTALVYFEDLTEEEQKKAYAKHAETVNSANYAVIAGVDLDTEQYIIYVNHLGSDLEYESYETIGDYHELFGGLVKNGTDAAYRNDLLRRFRLDHLREHFSESDDLVTYEFLQTLNHQTFWVRLEAARAEKGSGKIVLYFTDITEEKEKELEFEKVRQSLALEHERALKAELQSMVDPLTGTYNRKGFEYAVERYRNEKSSVGFVLLDVDNFKTLNDSYGHAFGDEILTIISERLLATFRNEDKVFRLGGDEFALLLYGCKEDAFRSLQMKFSGIHRYLRDKVTENVTITLSAGFCQSDDGYSDEMYNLSDIALYHTKNTGRAGLTEVGSNHEIRFVWHDSYAQQSQKEVLKKLLFGNWRVEISKDDAKTKKLFLDDAAYAILDVPGPLSPEECYTFWHDRISQRHIGLYGDVLQKLKEDGRAECTYYWNHPSRGELLMRIVADSQDYGSVLEYYGYMREVNQSDIVLSQDDGRFLMQAMNKLYFCTYYFNLNSGDYYILKGHENEPDVRELHHDIDVTFRKFSETFVHPDDREKVAAFSDLSTLSERLKGKNSIDCEYLSVSSLGWCRSTIMPVKKDEQGNITHAISMSTSIDAAKKSELEKARKIAEAMNLQLRAGEIVSKTLIIQTALIDAETGDTKVWTNAVFTEPPISCSFSDMKAWGSSRVYCEDAETFSEKFNLKHITRNVAERDHYEISVRYMEQEDAQTSVVFHFEFMHGDSSKILMVIEDASSIVAKFVEKNDMEIERRRRISRNVADALGQSFLAVNLMDLTEDRFYVVRATEYSRKMLENCVTLEEGFSAFFRTLVNPDHLARMQEFCEISTIGTRLKGEKQISSEYLSTVMNRWCRTSFYPVEWDENGDVTQALFTVTMIDELQAKEIEQRNVSDSSETK